MKNVIYFIVDAMRYDVVASREALKAITPNIARLAERGFVGKVVANAQATQFVMPSLFTLSYPLDHGGYNDGILHRPKSFVELLRDNGYRTCQFSTCNQLGLSNGYDRGFDVIGMTSDYRTMLESRITRGISYWLGLWQKGEMTDAEFTEFLQRDFGALLDALVETLKRHDTSIWPPKLKRLNQWVGERCLAEKRLLDTEPMVVANKLKRVAAGLYWRYLGKRTVPQWRLFPLRILASISWRSRKVIAAQTAFPFLTLQHYQAVFGDVVDHIAAAVGEMEGRPWFLHMHMMDLHDCRAVNRPLHLLGRFKFLPRWLAARAKGLTSRRFLYDSMLMYVDQCFGRLLSELKTTGELERTVIMIIGDHGLQYAESPRSKTPIGERMHYEDVETPLILFGAEPSPPPQENLLDSRAATATLLHALDITPHQSFAKANAYNAGLDVVVSESCGHGASDLARRDIYFGVTGKSHRMFGVLTGQEFQVAKLYNRDADPKEMTNVAAEPASKPVIAALVKRLYEERYELFRLRGIEVPPVSPRLL